MSQYYNNTYYPRPRCTTPPRCVLGVTGSTGPTGPIGYTGVTGYTGYTGPTGLIPTISFQATFPTTINSLNNNSLGNYGSLNTSVGANAFSTITGTWTINVAGNYQIYGQVSLTPTNAYTGNVILSIYGPSNVIIATSSIPQAIISLTNAGQSMSLIVSTICYLNVGNTIYLSLSGTPASNLIVSPTVGSIFYAHLYGF